MQFTIKRKMQANLKKIHQWKERKYSNSSMEKSIIKKTHVFLQLIMSLIIFNSFSYGFFLGLPL